MNAPAQARTLSDVAQKPSAVPGTDITINMFSAQGFALAQRLATAYMSSNAVPAPFRSVTTKREKQGNDYVDVEIPNPSAMGNCLVAIETALAVGMSITAVMQNANIIEGRLTWSAKFVIASINSSGRFHPLRFDMVNKGLIKATYKEKGSWNRDQKRYDMIEKEVEIENHVCIAWTLPRTTQFPSNVHSLADAKAASLPVIESAPVSMKLAVEEGWYSKPGSKWQTEMKYQMLQYRAGSFFGNIHAPDIVMGMGRTTEEALDTIEAVQQPDGSLAVDVDALRAASMSPAARRSETQATDVQSKDVQGKQAEPAAASSDAPAGADSSAVSDSKTPLSEGQIAERLNSATTIDALDSAVQLIADVPDPDAEVRLTTIAQQVRAKLDRGSRRTRGAGPSVE
jgi:hypothetical protein